MNVIEDKAIRTIRQATTVKFTVIRSGPSEFLRKGFGSGAIHSLPAQFVRITDGQ